MRPPARRHRRSHRSQSTARARAKLRQAPRLTYYRGMPHSRASSAGFIDAARVDALLAPILPDSEDRAFVVRCLLGEGPVHHRGANYVLLVLLGKLVDKLDAADVDALRARGTLPVPMKVPPHLERPGSLMTYPLPLPTAPLEQLA